MDSRLSVQTDDPNVPLISVSEFHHRLHQVFICSIILIVTGVIIAVAEMTIIIIGYKELELVGILDVIAAIAGAIVVSGGVCGILTKTRKCKLSVSYTHSIISILFATEVVCFAIYEWVTASDLLWWAYLLLALVTGASVMASIFGVIVARDMAEIISLANPLRARRTTLAEAVIADHVLEPDNPYSMVNSYSIVREASLRYSIQG